MICWIFLKNKKMHVKSDNIVLLQFFNMFPNRILHLFPFAKVTLEKCFTTFGSHSLHHKFCFVAVNVMFCMYCFVDLGVNA